MFLKLATLNINDFNKSSTHLAKIKKRVQAAWNEWRKYQDGLEKDDTLWLP